MKLIDYKGIWQWWDDREGIGFVLPIVCLVLEGWDVKERANEGYVEREMASLYSKLKS